MNTHREVNTIQEKMCISLLQSIFGRVKLIFSEIVKVICYLSDDRLMCSNNRL